MELTISRRDEDGITSLTLVGSIDLISRQELITAGKDVLGEGGSLRLDMAGVDFMDSMGIGALIELARHAESLGRSFVITEKSPRVRRVLQATGLDDAWQPA
jgi:anti-anti-sigma factor